MSSMFSLIPVKLVFFGFAIYIWKQLIQQGTSLNQPLASRLMLGAGVLGIILSVLSIGKVYPYGLTSDLLVFAIATSLFMALPMKTAAGRLIGLLIISVPVAGPLAYILHYLVVGGPVNKDSFIAIFQTTSAEATEYLSTFTSVVSVIPVVITSLIIILVVKHSNKPDRRPLSLKKASAYIAIATISLYLIPLEKSLFNYPAVTYQSYQKEIKVTKERIAQFSETAIDKNYTATKQGSSEIYVVVVGESLNKHHMGIYGYELQTTPELQQLKDKGELFVSTNSFSNYPGTMSALSHALTAANQKNQKHYTESLGIVELLNDAGFATHWLGNQPLSNSYDMILGLIANEAQDVQLTFDVKFHSMSHKDHKPDGVLLPLYEELLSQRDTARNHVIFVHLMGNHTDYCERYPEEYQHYEMSFSEELYSHIFKGGLGHSRECYDNSVHYNDHIVSSLITNLSQALGENGVGGLIYFADHSEDIERGVGHSTANFSFDMVESPALVWLSKGYTQSNRESTSNLTSNIEKYYPNDFIFDTVIGMTGIEIQEPESNIYCAGCDLFNSEYNLPLDEARTMHGNLPYKPLKLASDKLVQRN